MSNSIDIFLSFFVYILVFIEIFINMPMNGVYRLPGNWTKDSTIVAVLVAAGVLSVYFTLPWYASIILFILYKVYLDKKFATNQDYFNQQLSSLRNRFPGNVISNV